MTFCPARDRPFSGQSRGESQRFDRQNARLSEWSTLTPYLLQPTAASSSFPLSSSLPLLLCRTLSLSLSASVCLSLSLLANKKITRPASTPVACQGRADGGGARRPVARVREALDLGRGPPRAGGRLRTQLAGKKPYQTGDRAEKPLFTFVDQVWGTCKLRKEFFFRSFARPESCLRLL